VDLAQLQESIEAQASLALNQRDHPRADSRQVLVGAQEQADLLKHNAIGAGHMLLAMLESQAPMLTEHGIDIPILRDKLLELLPSDESAL
ncbi:MAG: Clp protease N-terminal domain-containing protein, partial [Phycisphaerales bacterium]